MAVAKSRLNFIFQDKYRTLKAPFKLSQDHVVVASNHYLPFICEVCDRSEIPEEHAL